MPALISSLATPRAFECEILAAEPARLMLYCSAAFDLRTLVKVETSDTLWMGEVWACEPAPSGFSIEIELTQVLRHLSAIERMAARFRNTPHTEKTSQQPA